MKKNFKLVLALALAVMMLLGSVSAFAAQGDAITKTKGEIVVRNAAKGETYNIYKIFGATISEVKGAATATATAKGHADSGKADGISYFLLNNATTLPSELQDAFETIPGTTPTQVKAIDSKTDAEIIAAVKAYIAAANLPTAQAAKIGDGKAVKFSDLDFGYYYVSSSQGTNVTIDSANPTATVYDKNNKTVQINKTVNEDTWSIGDTITYTGTFDTVNYLVPETGEDHAGDPVYAKKVTSYVISDTLPEFLSDVKITSVIVTKMDGTTTDEDLSDSFKKFDDNKSITIPWATFVNRNNKAGETGNHGTYVSKYDNGAKIIITYTAVLTDVTNIDAWDTNTLTIQPKVWKDTPVPGDDDDEQQPWSRTWSDEAQIKTFAAALKKVDINKSALTGAKFKFTGLETKLTSPGVYTVVKTGGSTETEMEVGPDGVLYIVGLDDDITLVGTETVAPVGYNRLTTTFGLNAQVMSKSIYKSSGYINYDAKGNVVDQGNYTESKNETRNLEDLKPNAIEIENQKGAELPSTGGIGTTIFYVAGSLMVLAAAILLITKRRMGAED